MRNVFTKCLLRANLREKYLKCFMFVAGTAAVPKEGTTDNSQTATLNKRVSSIKKVYLDINVAHDRMCHINEKDLRATMNKYGIELTGKMNPCPAC